MLPIVAPPAPVAWSPGTPPLSESLRARVRAGAGSVADHVVTMMPASGRQVVAVPVGAAMRRLGGADRPPRPAAERIAVPVAPVEAPVGVPWPSAVPVEGVVVRTSRVPVEWLRPSTPSSRPPAGPLVAAHRASEPGAIATVARPTARRAERGLPASVRIRKAAVMAFGLLVSLVAVEAAARVGRR